jgi:hypothetical protein
MLLAHGNGTTGVRLRYGPKTPPAAGVTPGRDAALAVAVSSSQQLLASSKPGPRNPTVGRVGALRQAVIGLTTAITLPVVEHIVDRDLAAAYGAVVAVLILGWL